MALIDNINLYKKLVIEVDEPITDIITCVQEDADSRYLDVQLFKSGVSFDLSGTKVRIYMVKPDGTNIMNDGEITDAVSGRCQFLLTTQALAACGILKTQIKVFSETEEQILSTQIFKIDVTESLLTNKTIESTNEYGSLVILFQDIYEALQVMTAIKNNFGEPGETAQTLPATTFWQMLEYLYNVNADALKNASVSEVLKRIGETGDSVGSNKDGSVMGKLNTLYTLLTGGMVIFDTVGTHEFTVPDGITKIRITATASGGGSGASLVLWETYSSPHKNLIKGGGAGSSGQSINKKEYSVTPKQTILIKIGTPGLSAIPSVEDVTGNRRKVSDGNNAEPTVIGDLITLIGGIGGNGADCSGTYFENEDTEALGGESAGIGSEKGDNGSYSYIRDKYRNFGGENGLGGVPSIGGNFGKGADAGRARDLIDANVTKESAIEYLQSTTQEQGNVGMVKIEWGTE